MAQGLFLSQKMALSQMLAPQLQQSLALLQAPMLELQALVNQELEQNPVLEELIEQELKSKDSSSDTESDSSNDAGEGFSDSDDSNDSRVDYTEDQTYDDPLVGKKLRCNYDSGWHTGKIEYFNTKLEEYVVFFEDESSDYIKKSDIDGLEIILLGDNLATSLIGKS